jgi:ribosome-associated protein
MRTESFLQLVQETLLDAKGRDMRTLDVRSVTDITDYMLIVNGTSNRHIVSMADKVIERAREHGRRPIGVEGQDLGDWVLIDFGDLVVHLMRPQTREFYSLEKLWVGGERPTAVQV